MASTAMGVTPSRFLFLPSVRMQSLATSLVAHGFWQRNSNGIKGRYRRCKHATFSTPSGVEDIRTSSLPEEDVLSIAENCNSEVKIHVEVSGAKTREIFDDVFDKMVAAAQPIPGFRRVKGGKTPNVPRDVLLELLGPSNVYKQVIKKVINSTVAEYVEKEGLHVSKDLRIVESYEELENMFEPDKGFSFNAVVTLKETKL